jgi:hypothetical protein
MKLKVTEEQTTQENKTEPNQFVSEEFQQDETDDQFFPEFDDASF